MQNGQCRISCLAVRALLRSYLISPQVSGAQNNSFAFGTATAGVASSAYQICWAAGSSYSFRVGRFQMSGPFTAATSCTLSQACALQLSGLGLATSNLVRILESSDSCGSSAPAVSTFVGLSSETSPNAAAPYLPAPTSVSADGWFFWIISFEGTMLFAYGFSEQRACAFAQYLIFSFCEEVVLWLGARSRIATLAGKQE